MQEWKWQHNIRRTFLNFIHYNRHELVELYLPSNFKKRRPGTVEKKQNPNGTKTIQTNCKLM